MVGQERRFLGSLKGRLTDTSVQDFQYAYDLNYMMIPSKEAPLPLFPPRTTISRPSSEATEIFEDEEEHSNCYNDSPMRSVASVS